MQLWLCDDGLQAKPFSVAAKKIRIDRGSRCCHGYCRRNHSLLPQRKLESAAKVFAAMPAVGGTFSFAATRIESAAELVVATTASDGTILLCRKEN